MRIFRNLLVLLFIFLPSAMAEPRFEASLDHSKINTAETATFSIQAEWAKSEAKYQFAFPPLNLLENLTVVRQGESQESFAGEGGEWIRKIFRFELQGKKAGDAKIPSFEVSYIDAAQQIAGRYAVPAQKLKITRKAGMKPFLIAFAIMLVIIEAAVLLFRAAEKRKAKQLAAEALPPAAANLENFRMLMENNTFLTRDFTEKLGRSLKTFLQEAYGVNVSGSRIQPSDAISQLEAKGLGRDEIYEIKTVLNTWEEINYAGRVSDASFREFRSQLIRLIQNKRAAVSS